MTREGVTVPTIETFDAASLALDHAGDGDVTVPFTDVAPGTYPVTFHARTGDFGAAVHGMLCPDCDTILQAPGHFSTTVDLLVPP
jgi:hypothetical protein